MSANAADGPSLVAAAVQAAIREGAPRRTVAAVAAAVAGTVMSATARPSVPATMHKERAQDAQGKAEDSDDPVQLLEKLRAVRRAQRLRKKEKRRTAKQPFHLQQVQPAQAQTSGEVMLQSPLRHLLYVQALIHPRSLKACSRARGSSLSMAGRASERAMTAFNIFTACLATSRSRAGARLIDGLAVNIVLMVSVAAKVHPDDRPLPESPYALGPLAFVHVAGQEVGSQGHSKSNPKEVQCVKHLLEALCCEPGEVGVITPYSAQAVAIRRALSSPQGAQVASVDGFQGSEKEVIVLSLVRSNPQGDLGFVADWRRLNVSITRARSLLIIVGNLLTLAQNELWRSFIGLQPDMPALAWSGSDLIPLPQEVQEQLSGACAKAHARGFVLPALAPEAQRRAPKRKPNRALSPTPIAISLASVVGHAAAGHGAGLSRAGTVLSAKPMDGPAPEQPVGNPALQGTPMGEQEKTKAMEVPGGGSASGAAPGATTIAMTQEQWKALAQDPWHSAQGDPWGGNGQARGNPGTAAAEAAATGEADGHKDGDWADAVAAAAEVEAADEGAEALDREAQALADQDTCYALIPLQHRAYRDQIEGVLGCVKDLNRLLITIGSLGLCQLLIGAAMMPRAVIRAALLLATIGFTVEAGKKKEPGAKKMTDEFLAAHRRGQGSDSGGPPEPMWEPPPPEDDSNENYQGGFDLPAIPEAVDESWELLSDEAPSLV
ncbi:unnamed protein product [Prorocentrum cordatum]|uniref:DNA2/NAM7 helicase-like C-terminal domain-containing protein n=1 Tax=Prorocentrum cordatum TaxID=2364126 RepID=A0ABN9UR97_9DINO|nr:unnamed protein product [Polarella glacialis]